MNVTEKQLLLWLNQPLSYTNQQALYDVIYQVGVLDGVCRLHGQHDLLGEIIAMYEMLYSSAVSGTYYSLEDIILAVYSNNRDSNVYNLGQIYSYCRKYAANVVQHRHTFSNRFFSYQ